jgi:hypothetical protein
MEWVSKPLSATILSTVVYEVSAFGITRDTSAVVYSQGHPPLRSNRKRRISALDSWQETSPEDEREL